MKRSLCSPKYHLSCIYVNIDISIWDAVVFLNTDRDLLEHISLTFTYSKTCYLFINYSAVCKKISHYCPFYHSKCICLCCQQQFRGGCCCIWLKWGTTKPPVTYSKNLLLIGPFSRKECWKTQFRWCCCCRCWHNLKIKMLMLLLSYM